MELRVMKRRSVARRQLVIPLRQRFDKQCSTSNSRNLAKAKAVLPASSTPHLGALLPLYSTMTSTSKMTPIFGPPSP